LEEHVTEPRCYAGRGVVIGALIAIAAFAGAPSAQAATPTCSLASAARVKSALGVTVASPQVTRNGPVTVCQFITASALLVRFQTSETTALYTFGRKSFGQHGVSTKTVSGLGTKAYSASIGELHTLVVLQGKTELLVQGKTPLPKLEALAKLILPTL
jgi:hypothetical protein